MITERIQQLAGIEGINEISKNIDGSGILYKLRKDISDIEKMIKFFKQVEREFKHDKELSQEARNLKKLLQNLSSAKTALEETERSFSSKWEEFLRQEG